MYRVPQKQTWRWTVLNCGRSCFHQVSYANHLSFSSNWNILHLLWLFDLLHILLHYFCDSIILSCQLKLSKEKNFVETLHLVPQRYVSILLRALTLICKLLLIRQIWLETKIWPFSDFLLSFSFSHACLLGHPVYFDHQHFLRFSSDFSFQLFNAGKLWEML